jgi:hypothetical protein
LDLTLDKNFPRRHIDCKRSIWQMGFMGKSAKVAVIDTGVDTEWLRQTFPFLPLDNIHPLDFTLAKEGAGECGGMQQHGTRVIAAILGGAPKAEIFSLRVYSESAKTTRQQFCDALAWCAKSGISVVNISQGFYFGCSSEDPCALCRAINTYSLTADLFAVIACGDPYTLNEQIEEGLPPAICPALHGELGWGLAGSVIVGDRRTELDTLVASDNGLSFVAADFAGGVALLRSQRPGDDIFAIRRSIRRTCTPLVDAPGKHLGVGRHCFLLAFLYQAGRAFGIDGPVVKSLKELRRPARGAVDALHDESLKYLMRIAVARVGKHNWRAAAEETADLYETVKSWTTPSHQATIAHVLAACLEAQGQMKKAAEYCEQFQRLEG